MNTNQLYKKAIKYWGLEAQMFMMFEEMAELQKAITKIWRGQGTKEDMADELADVEVMMEQMVIAFGIDVELIQMRKIKKLNRLKELLATADNIRTSDNAKHHR